MEAHPRACGENIIDKRIAVPHKGSSPRVRGKRAHGTDAVGPRGLIPARAGKTYAVKNGYAPKTAHPRACGENAKLQLNSLYGKGSSPRVRGKQQFGIEKAQFIGLIPARAGKTQCVTH